LINSFLWVNLFQYNTKLWFWWACPWNPAFLRTNCRFRGNQNQ